MRTSRAEYLSKKFADFLGDSVYVEQSSCTHRGIRFYESNGVPKTSIILSYFVKGICKQKEFDSLDETEAFINDYIKSREILFRRFG